MSAPTVQPARDKLLELAAVVRPDLDIHQLAGLLDNQHYVARLTAVRVQQEASRLIWSGHDLHDLRQLLDSLVLIRGGH